MKIKLFNDWKRTPETLIFFAFAIDTEDILTLHFWLFGFSLELDF